MNFHDQQNADVNDNSTGDASPLIDVASEEQPGTLSDLPVERDEQVTGEQVPGQTVRVQFRVTKGLVVVIYNDGRLARASRY